MTIPACIVAPLMASMGANRREFGVGTHMLDLPAGVTKVKINMVAGGGGGAGRINGSTGENGQPTIVDTFSEMVQCEGGFGGHTAPTYAPNMSGSGGEGGYPSGKLGVSGKYQSDTVSPNPNLNGYGYGGAGAQDNSFRGQSGGGGGSGGYYLDYWANATEGAIRVIVGKGGRGDTLDHAHNGGDGRVIIEW